MYEIINKKEYDKTKKSTRVFSVAMILVIVMSGFLVIVSTNIGSINAKATKFVTVSGDVKYYDVNTGSFKPARFVHVFIQDLETTWNAGIGTTNENGRFEISFDIDPSNAGKKSTTILVWAYSMAIEVDENTMTGTKYCIHVGEPTSPPRTPAPEEDVIIDDNPPDYYLNDTHQGQGENPYPPYTYIRVYKTYGYKDEKGSEAHQSVFVNSNYDWGNIYVSGDITSRESSAPFYLVDRLVDGYLFVDNLPGTDMPGELRVRWKYGRIHGNHYHGQVMRTDPRTGNEIPGPAWIHISGESEITDDPSPSQWSQFTVLHECGHFIANAKWFGKNLRFADSASGVHYAHNNYSAQLAWSEGWAHFFACAVRDKQMNLPQPYIRNEKTEWDPESKPFIINFETGHICYGSTGNEYNVNGWLDCNEVAVAGLLWDIYDSSNDDQNSDGFGDRISMDVDEIWDVVKNYNSTPGNDIGVVEVEDFWGGWFVRANATGRADLLAPEFVPEFWEVFREHGNLLLDTQRPNSPTEYELLDDGAKVRVHYAETAEDDPADIAGVHVKRLSGIKGFRYILDRNQNTNVPLDGGMVDTNWRNPEFIVDIPQNVDGEDQLYLHVRAFDRDAEYFSDISHIQLRDTEPPETSAVLNPVQPDGNNGWYVSDVTVGFNAVDRPNSPIGTGVDCIEYEIDSQGVGTITGSSGSVVVSDDKQQHTVRYRGTDNAGNQESWKSISSFNIDKTPPDIIIGGGGSSAEKRYTITVTDATSGVAEVKYRMLTKYLGVWDNPPWKDISPSNDGSYTKELSFTTSGTYKIEVKAKDYAGNEALEASSDISIAYNDANTGGDAGNSFACASEVAPGEGYTAYIDETDTDDYYKFTVNAGNSIVISMTPSAGADFDLALYNPAGTRVAYSQYGTGVTDSVTYAADTTGSWGARIYRYSGSGTYSFNISVSSGGTASQNDANTGGDAGNEFASATEIIPSDYTGYITDAEDSEDWYMFAANTEDIISISMTPPANADFDLALYSPSNSRVAYSQYSGSTTDSITYTADASGSWVMYVYRYAGSGIYAFSLTITSSSGGSSPTQNDANTGTDAGNSFACASEVAPGEGYTAYIDETDTDDYYKFTVNAGNSIVISMTPSAGADFDLALYNPGGSRVVYSQAGGSSTDSVTYAADVSGSWVARIYRYSGGGTYAFSLQVTGNGGSGETTMTFENMENCAISDLQTTYSALTGVMVSGTVTEVTAIIEIIHTYQGDLIVDIGYEGCEYELRLWDGAGGGTDNLYLSVNLLDYYSADTFNAAHNWYLKVYDRYNGDTGYINYFAISVSSN